MLGNRFIVVELSDVNLVDVDTHFQDARETAAAEEAAAAKAAAAAAQAARKKEHERVMVRCPSGVFCGVLLVSYFLSCVPVLIFISACISCSPAVVLVCSVWSIARQVLISVVGCLVRVLSSKRRYCEAPSHQLLGMAMWYCCHPSIQVQLRRQTSTDCMLSAHLSPIYRSTASPAPPTMMLAFIPRSDCVISGLNMHATLSIVAAMCLSRPRHPRPGK